MAGQTTISVRITQQQNTAFEKALQELKLTKSQYLKACIDRISKDTRYEKEMTLAALGFTKKEQWTK